MPVSKHEDGQEQRSSSSSSLSSSSSPKVVEDDYTRGLKIFVGGISWGTSDKALEEFFSKFGTVTKAVIMRKNDGKTRGFGFVTFAETEEANAAVTASDEELMLDGKRLDPKLAFKSAKAIHQQAQYKLGQQQLLQQQHQLHKSGKQDSVPQSTKLFVGGISNNTTKQDLIVFFTRFGTVVEASVMKNRDTGKARGFGFITLNSQAAVDAVLNSGPHVIGDKEVECKRAVPKVHTGGNDQNLTKGATKAYPYNSNQHRDRRTNRGPHTVPQPQYALPNGPRYAPPSMNVQQQLAFATALQREQQLQQRQTQERLANMYALQIQQQRMEQNLHLGYGQYGHAQPTHEQRVDIDTAMRVEQERQRHVRADSGELSPFAYQIDMTSPSPPVYAETLLQERMYGFSPDPNLNALAFQNTFVTRTPSPLYGFTPNYNYDQTPTAVTASHDLQVPQQQQQRK